jgi:adenylate cyclase
MAEERVQRRLAAILAADVVGYSRLMGEDETGTLTALKELRATLIDPTVTEYRGRIVKLMGDGALVEFASVVDAVECAVSIQRSVLERNADVLDSKRIEFRIGVNLGDIIIDGDDIYGDGVNVAARLEGLAEPGGVCVSEKVFAEVRNKLDTGFEDLGPQEVKNIAEPVHAYRTTTVRAPAPPRGDLPLPDKPSIAVLPFDNLSGDPEQEYFADGIAEDIITSLSRLPWFFVIARNSSFSFKGDRTSVRQVAEALGVKYVLEGSVRRSGDRVRVTGQLIDATTDQHIWAERYDRMIDDIFAVQDEITEQIIGSVAPGILTTEIQRARRKDVASLDVWDRIMRAHWHYARLTKEDAAEAIRLLNEAVEIDPGSAMALGDLAMIEALSGHWGWAPSLEESLASADSAARRAIEADDTNAWGYIALGLVDLLSRRHGGSIRNLRRAIELSPNEPHAYSCLGLTFAFSGDYNGAVGMLDDADRLSPRDRFRALWMAYRAVAGFGAGKYEEAVSWAKSAIEQNPEIPGPYRAMAAAYGQLGMLDEARSALSKAVELISGLTVTSAAAQLPWKNAEDAERYLDGLRKAGLPEE